jgi:hypothetical protein
MDSNLYTIDESNINKHIEVSIEKRYGTLSEQIWRIVDGCNYVNFSTPCKCKYIIYLLHPRKKNVNSPTEIQKLI